MKKIADWGEIWGLYHDGWALSALDEDDTRIFPIWPAREFAEACAQGEWSSYKPHPIDLDEFVEEYIPGFMQKGYLVGVFSHPSGQNVQMSPEEFMGFLEQELDEYR